MNSKCRNYHNVMAGGTVVRTMYISTFTQGIRLNKMGGENQIHAATTPTLMPIYVQLLLMYKIMMVISMVNYICIDLAAKLYASQVRCYWVSCNQDHACPFPRCSLAVKLPPPTGPRDYYRDPTGNGMLRYKDRASWSIKKNSVLHADSC